MGETLAVALKSPDYEIPKSPRIIGDEIVSTAEILLTDISNGARMVAKFGDEIRYAPGLGDRVWDGSRWAADDTRQWFRFAQETVKAMFEEAVEIPGKHGSAALRWACYSARVAGLRAMMDVARASTKVMTPASAFDRDLNAMNTLTGLVNLKTGAVRPTTPDDDVTKLARAHFDPNTECPNWLQFVSEIMGGKQHLVSCSR